MEASVKCPDCGEDLNIEGGEVGDYFECDTCACELILKSLDPPKVEVLEEEK